MGNPAKAEARWKQRLKMRTSRNGRKAGLYRRKRLFRVGICLAHSDSRFGGFLFYSKKTKSLSSKTPDEEKMTTAELAVYLKQKSIQQAACGAGPLICQCGARKKSVQFKLCWKCECKAIKQMKKMLAPAGKEKERKLPAKNRKKSKIIDALMAGLPLPKPVPSPEKPKTIRYQSLESALEKSRRK
jgi:hypothetical protein